VVSYYSDVCDFFDKFKVPKGTTPHIPDLESYQFRYKFMAEELEEFNRAFEESDLSGMADALVDLVYVALGTALVMGIPFDECWREVQAANMRKVRANGADDERSKRKHLLDVVKPEGWKPPDVAGVLLRAGLKKISTDRRGMDLARTAAQWSKDPTTKVGAAIVGEDPRRTSLGFNGFPPGIADTPERLMDRPTKHKLTQHAERNALDNAAFDTRGATMYTTLAPCIACAKSIVSKGIARVVCERVPEHAPWSEEAQEGRAILEEAGVRCEVQGG
jgi:dCMP deaminase